MVSEGGQQSQGKGKGFSGLSSLVSDVEEALAAAEAEVSRGQTPELPLGKDQTTGKGVKPLQQLAHGRSLWLSATRVLLVIAAVIGLLWLIGQSARKPLPQRQAQNQPKNSASFVPSTPKPKPIDQIKPAANQSAARSETPQRPTEERPQEGKNLVLAVAQIRYCLAEDIRIEASKNAINDRSDDQINRYNMTIEDYNSRCGQYRYRTGALESARRDIEPYRTRLQAEGRSRFASRSAKDPESIATASSSIPASTVRAVQNKLRTLGYDAGTADGVMGGKTRSAIVRFQRNQGLLADGVADNFLLFELNSGLIRNWITQANEAKLSGGPVDKIDAKLKELIEELGRKYDVKDINLRTCELGIFRSLCEHSWLTPEEARRVADVELRLDTARH